MNAPSMLGGGSLHGAGSATYLSMTTAGVWEAMVAVTQQSATEWWNQAATGMMKVSGS